MQQPAGLPQCIEISRMSLKPAFADRFVKGSTEAMFRERDVTSSMLTARMSTLGNENITRKEVNLSCRYIPLSSCSLRCSCRRNVTLEGVCRSWFSRTSFPWSSGSFIVSALSLLTVVHLVSMATPKPWLILPAFRVCFVRNWNRNDHVTLRVFRSLKSQSCKLLLHSHSKWTGVCAG